jgi:beta-mannosidase
VTVASIAGAEVDLLADACWECTSSAPTGIEPQLPSEALEGWLPATVPGTAAQARRDAGDAGALTRDYVSRDWWFRCRFPAPDASTAHTLRCDGLATIADVWLNGVHVLHNENMFVAREVEVEQLQSNNELLIRFAALAPILAPRRPRPRWKCRDLVHQNLRWIRTSLTGRLTGGVAAPAPVGPWRPVTLSPRPDRVVVRKRLQPRVDLSSSTGEVDVEVELRGCEPDVTASVRVGHVEGRLTTSVEGTAVVARGTIAMGPVELWWPHTHGAQPLYEVVVMVEAERHAIGRIGFRALEVDRADGHFTLRCNGEDLFCRGVCWTPPDTVTLNIPTSRLRRKLQTIRDGNMNMVRVTGIGVYETDDFFDACDELGLLVWQDCMFAFYDAPDTTEFRATVTDEVDQLLHALQGRPSLAVVCGGSENEQQAAYLGLPPDQWATPVAETLIPRLVEQLVPSTPYVRSSPGESALPSRVDHGPGHYFGVGAYLAPLEDARRASVRFASECLSFANPPEPLDTPDGIRAARGIGHRPEWKAGIHRDSDTSWDLEDVRDWYTRALFGIDTVELRRLDGERANAVARATVATIYESVLTEWRRPGSTCAGAIVLQAHDGGFGGGIGMVDGLDRPKSSWYVMRRVMAPRAVLFTDEGVNGLGLHVVADSPEPWIGSLRLSLYLHGEVEGDSVTTDVKVVDGHASIDTGTIFGGFRDLNYAHKFAPPAYDVVAATLRETDGTVLSRAFFLPGQGLRAVEPDLGLRAVAAPGQGATWTVTVSTNRFAQWVSFDVAGWIPDDSWFHLTPDMPASIRLRPTNDAGEPPRGRVVAVNAVQHARLELAP